jgi:hypothetical protein
MSGPAELSERVCPTADEIARGIEYCSIIDDDVGFGGTIWRHPDVVCWRFYSEPQQSPYSPASLLRKPQLIFTDGDWRECLRIRRSPELRRLHYILRGDEIIGSIKLTTVLRNNYSIQLDGCPVWTFQLPLFKILFHAYSSKGEHIWIKVWKSKQRFRLLVPPEVEATPKKEVGSAVLTGALLPALAFVHREWWCFG